jgi:hypothetical protein
VLRVTKTISQQPTPDADGVYTIGYRIDITNEGAATTYGLRDQMEYGDGLAIIGARAENVAPGSIAIDPGWDGTTSRQLVKGVPIGAGARHRYQITVQFTVASEGLTAAAGDCRIDAGEHGSGVINGVRVEWNHGASRARACEEVSGLPPTDAVARQASAVPVDRTNPWAAPLVAVFGASVLTLLILWRPWTERRRR